MRKDGKAMGTYVNPGNAAFRMDACFDTYEAELSVSSRFGYAYEMTRLYGFY